MAISPACVNALSAHAEKSVGNKIFLIFNIATNGLYGFVRAIRMLFGSDVYWLWIFLAQDVEIWVSSVNEE